MLERNIATTADWANKSAALTDMFYMLPALTTAYSIEGAEYIDIAKAVCYTYADFENDRVKIRDGVTDALVSGVLCRKVNGEIKRLQETLDAFEPATLAQRRDALQALLQLLATFRVGIGMHGLEVSFEANEQFAITVQCYCRGELMGQISAPNLSGMLHGMLCPSHSIAKHQVLSLRVVIECADYTCILANRADGVSGAVIYGEAIGCIKTTLDQLGVDLGQLDGIRSIN